MRINGINNVNHIYKTRKASAAYGKTSVKKSSDSLAISDFARELSIANKAVKNSPEVREAEVDPIKKQIEAGEYNVTAKDVADKLVEQYFV